MRAALDYVRQGDVLIVWKLDRLGRSLPHLIGTVTSLATRGIGFCSLTEAWSREGRRGGSRLGAAETRLDSDRRREGLFEQSRRFRLVADNAGEQFAEAGPFGLWPVGVRIWIK